MRAPWESIAYHHPVVFEPVSTTALISMGLTAVGTGISALSAIRQGEATSNAAEYNAALAQRNSVIATQQAGAAASQQQRDARARIGAARAAYGASGVTSEGSPLDVLEASATAAEGDRQAILYRGRLKALGYTDEAMLDSYRAGTASQNATLSAGSSILMGAGALYKQYKGTSSPDPGDSGVPPKYTGPNARDTGVGSQPY